MEIKTWESEEKIYHRLFTLSLVKGAKWENYHTYWVIIIDWIANLYQFDLSASRFRYSIWLMGSNGIVSETSLGHVTSDQTLGG